MAPIRDLIREDAVVLKVMLFIWMIINLPARAGKCPPTQYFPFDVDKDDDVEDGDVDGPGQEV